MVMTKTRKKHLADWTLFERVWLLSFTLITIGLFIAWNDTWIGLLAALTGMLTVVLTAKGKISSYYFGIPNVILYAYLAYQNSYFGEVQLNLLYFLPMSIIGLILWKQNRNKKKTLDDVRVRYLSWRERALWIILSIIAITGYGYYLQSLGGELPFFDSATTVLSVIAMILLVQRTVEQWVSWIIVDVLTIFLWLRAFMADGNDVTILVMWCAYLINAVYGLYNWMRLERAQ